MHQKQEVLKTYNLKKIVKFLQQNNICSFSKGENLVVSAIDGFYFTTRYPGADAESIDKYDPDNCMEALQICHSKAIELTMQAHIKQSESNAPVAEQDDYER